MKGNTKSRMENREAINLLNEIKQMDDSMYAYNPAYMEAIDLAICALEKRTPKRNLQKNQYNDNLFSVRCPSCSAHLGTYNKRLNTFTYAHSEYCPDCGQAIDWRKPCTKQKEVH